MKYVMVILILSAAVLAQLSPAPGAHLVTLTPQPGFFNEPSIAINPQNPQQLVTAWQTNASIAYTTDAGAHWTTAASTAPPDYRISGDVSVTYDTQGHAILCYIAFDKLGTTNYWGHKATRNGIFIRRSLDGGATWERDAIAVVSHRSDPGIPFEDKPYVVADNGAHSLYRGNLYVGWTQFTLTKSVILLSRSTDGGTAWSRPIEISTHEGLPRDDNGSVEGFTGAVAPDGTLYVVWADDNAIAFTSSHDGGRTFAPSRTILKTAPPYFQVDGVSRANGFPQIGWGPCRGAACVRTAGVLYVTWSDYRNGDTDVFCATSRDGGRTWSKPVRVSSDSVHNGADQFFQWLAVDPVDGSANIVFYDRRNDPENQSALVILARSSDAGRTWTNHAFTEQAFTANDDFLGDYTAIAALNGRVYAAWAEEVPPPKTPAAPKSGTSATPGSAGISAGQAQQQDQTVSAKPAHRTVVRVGSANFSGQQH